MKWFASILCILLITVVHTPLAAAQFSPVGNNNGFRMVINPTNPEPNSVITARVIDQLRLNPIASITWTIDGEVVDELTNRETAPILTGDIGDTTSVSATVQLLSGEVLQFSETVTAARLDLIVEANTITPALYTGRALPTLGSTMRVTALPFASEGATDPADYTYRWRVNEQAVTGQQQGANQIVVPTDLDRRVEVEVEVFNPDNTLLTSGSVNIPLGEPEIVYYEVHPLRGLLPTALPSPYIFTGNEMQLRAEPYFMNATLLSNLPRLSWQLNGRTITNPNTDPYEITLRRQGDSGSFRLNTDISHPTRLLQRAEANIQVRF